MVGASWYACALPRPGTFDPTLWRLDSGSGWCGFRSRMVDDVLAERLEPGTPRDDVLALLGDPTNPGAYVPEGGDPLTYSIDCWIDCNWLVVLFDGDRRLTEASIRQD